MPCPRFRAIICLENDKELLLLDSMVRKYRPKTSREKSMKKKFLIEIEKLKEMIR